MKLQFIALDKLSVSKANMRYAKKAPDVSDILPTVRTRGVLQPLLVRPCWNAGRDGVVELDSTSGHYEIVAGCRRFHAAKIVDAERIAAQAVFGSEGDGRAADERTANERMDAERIAPGLPTGSTYEAGMVPCAILGDTDDAAAIEASLIENVARLDPDEVSRWECFTRLVREGRSPEQIGQTFGLPDLAVKRTLALGNLLPRIREMYRRDEIDAATIRHLTLASKARQKAWLALADDPDSYAPRGHQLKAWLLGGNAIATRHALFALEGSGLAVVADLFGEDAYFADALAFWDMQNAAIEARRLAYIEAGWADAVVVRPDTHFHSWEYGKTPKRRGGRVYIDVRGNGEVVFHEGYLSHREAERLARAEARGASGEPPVSSRPEMTSTTRRYVDLHRHAALRASLLDAPGTALRLLVAHAIAGSPLWRVGIEDQATKNEDVRESVAGSRAESLFDQRRRSVLDALGFDGEDATVTGGGWSGPSRKTCAIFARLAELPDAAVLDVAAVVMGETLAAGSAEIDAVGQAIGLDMAAWWQADDAFLDTLRDREVLLAMVREIAGGVVADANAKEKTKTLKGIIRDTLAGRDGRVCIPAATQEASAAGVEAETGAAPPAWVPRWMAFPSRGYTARFAQAQAASSPAAQAPGIADPDDPEVSASMDDEGADEPPVAGEVCESDDDSQGDASDGGSDGGGDGDECGGGEPRLAA